MKKSLSFVIAHFIDESKTNRNVSHIPHIRQRPTWTMRLQHRAPDVVVGEISSVFYTVEDLQKHLRAKLPAGLEVLQPETRGQALENTVAAMRVGMLITSFVALFVGVYIIFNSFTISVNQRWKEIGILRTIGVERGNIIRMFLGEAFAMGTVGSLLGIVAGFYLAAAASKVMGTVAASVYGTLTTPQAVVFRMDYALLSFAVGAVSSLLGAWLPARAASQLDPIMALHNIESRRKESVLGWRRVLLGALLIVSSMALVWWSPSRVGMTFQFVYAVLMLLGLTAVLPISCSGPRVHCAL